MNFTARVLTGLSAIAIVFAAPGAIADDNWQHIDVGVGNFGDGFGDYNAVAVAALQQNSVQIVTSETEITIGQNFDARMEFAEGAFQNQTFNNNNFNSGVNAVQGNAMAVSSSTNGGGGGPALAGLGF